MGSPIADALVAQGVRLYDARRVPTRFTGDPEADALLSDLDGHPYAFVLACLADRQVKAERAWMIPLELSRRLNAASFDALAAKTEDEVVAAFTAPPSLHRYGARVARSIHLGLARIADQYDGDASRIWGGVPSSAEVVLRFLEFDGAGPKIATMAANILARDFKVEFSDYVSIDISADVHVRRVFARLGLIKPHSSVEEVVYRARALHPEFPGLMDLPCWQIGRDWCHASDPECVSCSLSTLCPTFAAAAV